ncbi:MAG: hypothetical protein COV34_00960 [Candidatus Zambryskibacteria bacterium CG10_big_fil_rev_8_21_14_0_10_42_12]|uniref:DUF4015 domain-containing protein n=1 Tax=Candidatus Zambryskibacteria bacterium CG10_big_fil_rev_8_21_14_0_10_42_12 TaxID=1975115 RepID=A0A2H0QV82_9BACT|nr:MAG: hypothetical protein COV34_00960 [Candidatus Zambryskibacteria bacterium CG10_big_fil_rev_8_21_14_0_10_42_12]
MARKPLSRTGVFVISTFGVLLIAFVIYTVPKLSQFTYESIDVAGLEEEMVSEVDVIKKNVYKAKHLKTPDAVKAIYMTSWIAGTPSLRQSRVIDVIDTTEINSVVIDIKDDTGKISFITDDPMIEELGWSENRVADMKDLIEMLHEKDIYVIGRLAVFQDPYMTKTRPDLAAKFASDPTKVWTDRKGLSWIDPGAKEYWDMIARIAFAAHRIGFDEINFDYIRFPSDGNVDDIYYPFSGNRILASSFHMEKARIIQEFWKYLYDEVRNGKDPITGDKFEGKISADIFGMTTTASDDMRIGQVFEYALPYFDYIAPMVYPSHYPTGFYGITNVNAVPGTVISISMGEAVRRVEATSTIHLLPGESQIASSTLFTKKSYDRNKLRPWLQDNDYPVHYTAEMVRAQIDASEALGLNSWMLWDPANTYTISALLPE